MLNIKVFNDGERKVVIFEGDNVTKIPDTEILSKLLTAFNATGNVETKEEKVEPMPAATPEPINEPAKEEKAPAEVKEVKKEDVNPYLESVTGSDPKSNEAGFIDLCAKFKDKSIPKEERHLISGAIKTYCNNRFANTDAENYVRKCSVKQLSKFIEMFGFLVPSVKADMDNEQSVRNAVKTMITKFKA